MSIENKLVKKAKTAFGTFYVMSNDYIGKKCLAGKHYEEVKIRRALGYLTEGDCVVDIGASYGIHTIPYAQTVGISGKVYCFEPQKMLYSLLQKNIEINVPNHQVIALNMALGHEEMETTMNKKCEGRNVSYTKSSYNYGGLDLGIGGEKAELKTLDSFQLDNVRLIKIDVEGAERIVINGAKKTIERCLPIVYYEQNKKKITSGMIKSLKLPKSIINFDIKKYLGNLGYQFYKQGCMVLSVPPS